MKSSHWNLDLNLTWKFLKCTPLYRWQFREVTTYVHSAILKCLMNLMGNQWDLGILAFAGEFSCWRPCRRNWWGRQFSCEEERWAATIKEGTQYTKQINLNLFYFQLYCDYKLQHFTICCSRECWWDFLVFVFGWSYNEVQFGWEMHLSPLQLGFQKGLIWCAFVWRDAVSCSS